MYSRRYASDGCLAIWMPTEGGGARACFRGCLGVALFQKIATPVAITGVLAKYGGCPRTKDVETKWASRTEAGQRSATRPYPPTELPHRHTVPTSRVSLRFSLHWLAWARR
jgi:hypothetical protein